MSQIKRDWELLSDDKRRSALADIITYFSAERNEKIGLIAAEHILDFFLRTIGVSIYNKALDDTKPFLEKSFESALIDLDISLRKLEERKMGEEK